MSLHGLCKSLCKSLYKIGRQGSLICMGLYISSCSHFFSTNEPKTPPVIQGAMPFEQVLEAALEFGGKTLVDAKKHFKHHKQWSDVDRTLSVWLLKKGSSSDPARLINAVHLYQASKPTNPDRIFKVLARVVDRPVVLQAAWHIAASLPSKSMGNEVENLLTEAIHDNEITFHLIPKMAEALVSNRLKSAYTVLRQGLFQTNHVAFAQSMEVLDGQRASWDFVDYLAKAPPEELRQLNLASVDVFTCTEILQYLASTPPPLNHPQIEHLFYFSISRNTALAEMSRKILESFMPKHTPHLSFMLARMPGWVQLAFVENVRKDMNPILGLFLAELKQTTAQNDVVEDIEDIKL